jgi:hypothetical protein
MQNWTRTLWNRAALACALAMLVVTAEAGTVYRWTDASGAVHFSDQPPPEGAGPAAEVDLAPAPAGPAAGSDYYSITNQARRMEQQRLEAERQQAETEAARRRAAAGDQAPPPSATPASEGEGGGPGWIVGPGYWAPGLRPGHGPPGAGWWPQFPERPAQRPPQRPGPDRPGPGRPPIEREPPSFGVAVPRR